jgi:hypothetical protein
VTGAPQRWEGAPFPGLRPLDERDAPICFGRGLEIADLIGHLRVSRFTAVVAASGSGKSSLVAAGLIPRLRDGAIVSPATNSADWRIVRFTPGQGQNPFSALFAALLAAFPEHAISPHTLAQERDAFVKRLKANPGALVEVCDGLLRESGASKKAEILLFIDQFEELFTVVDEGDRSPFVTLLEAAHGAGRMRCLVAVRADCYASCLALPSLAAMLRAGTYPLHPPAPAALYEMITRPAERASLTWDEGLPERILDDMASEPGALVPMACALEALYLRASARGDGRLSRHDYKQELGGVHAAINSLADQACGVLTSGNAAQQRALRAVFQELVAFVEVDGRSVPTVRRSAALHSLPADSDEARLVTALVRVRLLVTDEGSVQVAHEAILRHWDALGAWLGEMQDGRALIRQYARDASKWADRGRDTSPPPHEALVYLYNVLDGLGIDRETLPEPLKSFVEPEQARRLRELDEIHTGHQRRAGIGDRLAEIGDTRRGVGLILPRTGVRAADPRIGIPDIVWCEVPGGTVAVDELGEWTVHPFYLARYPVTYMQFGAFRAQGYWIDDWWKGLNPDALRQRAEDGQNRRTGNHPVERVSWYEAMAFCAWLTAQYAAHGMLPALPGDQSGETLIVRLPTEWEWQQAATAGDPANEYPWGADWDTARANISENCLRRTTAVGMYPHGATRATQPILDMGGNVWEWCLNESESGAVRMASAQPRAVRGGSWVNYPIAARTAARDNWLPAFRLVYLGFRVAAALPVPQDAR